jgi:hypothetical protein
MNHATRETYLQAATTHLAPLFARKASPSPRAR